MKLPVALLLLLPVLVVGSPAGAGELPTGWIAARGDSDSFARLLARHRDRVFQLVRWWLGPRSLWAEAVAQEVFLQVFRSAASFAGRSSFKTWLYSLALNVCRRHRRHETRTPGRDGSDEAALMEVRDASLDPLARLEDAERVGSCVVPSRRCRLFSRRSCFCASGKS